MFLSIMGKVFPRMILSSLPWWSAELERAMRHRNTLFKKEGVTSKFRSARNIFPAYRSTNIMVSRMSERRLLSTLSFRHVSISVTLLLTPPLHNLIPAMTNSHRHRYAQGNGCLTTVMYQLGHRIHQHFDMADDTTLTDNTYDLHDAGSLSRGEQSGRC